jgi:hypothetical protein
LQQNVRVKARDSLAVESDSPPWSSFQGFRAA